MSEPPASRLPWTRRRWLRRLLVGGSGLGGATTAKNLWLSAGPGWQGAPSDHFDGERFFNASRRMNHGFFDLLKWQWTRKKTAWPDAVEPVAPSRPPSVVDPGTAAVTMVGHATWLIQFPGFACLTDPVWSDRCSPVSWAGPRRIRPPAIPFEWLPKIDAILLSHNHYDHLDLPTLRRLRDAFSPQIVTGLGNRAFLKRHGFPDALELDWWDRHAFADTALATVFTPAQHWSNRGGYGENSTLWGGFWLSDGGAKVYFAGDSGYAGCFAAIGSRLGPADVALLPIGAYEPRWFMEPVHMNPADAVAALRDLGARRMLGCHYGTWQLTDEAIDDPLIALEKARAAAEIDPQLCRAAGFGETVVIRAASAE